MPDQQVQIPAGMVCVTTFGFLRQEMVGCLAEMRSASETAGLRNVKWVSIPGTLVEKARNEGVRQMLRENLQWILFIDGDMTFQADAMLNMLRTAYGEMPHIDVLGAWCPLRGELSLPTTDFGSGTWESSYPGSGPQEVIRTGAAFLLAKRHCFERLRDPWFRMRVPWRLADAMLELDNFARIKFNGENPFRGHPDQWWEKLEKIAQEDPSIIQENFVPVEVGEDSGFCDRARNAGLRIFVQMNVACGHVDNVVRTWQDHKKAMDEAQKQERLCSGLLQ